MDRYKSKITVKQPVKPVRLPKIAEFMPWPPKGHRKVTAMEYMEHVINDREASVERRDRMAIAAVQYGKAAELAIGKKGRQQVEATEVVSGALATWGDDLQMETRVN